jgi:hypothetical protein
LTPPMSPEGVFFFFSQSLSYCWGEAREKGELVRKIDWNIFFGWKSENTKEICYLCNLKPKNGERWEYQPLLLQHCLLKPSDRLVGGSTGLQPHSILNSFVVTEGKHWKKTPTIKQRQG